LKWNFTDIFPLSGLLSYIVELYAPLSGTIISGYFVVFHVGDDSFSFHHTVKPIALTPAPPLHPESVAFSHIVELQLSS